MTTRRSTIVVVEDDSAMRRAIQRLLRAAGWRACAFGSAESFVDADSRDVACLVVDIRLPGLSGPEMVDLLQQRRALPPLVFITAHLDAAPRVAHEVLLKPFSGTELLEAVGRAIARAG